MAKKKITNKGRDMLGDYWKTNRQMEQMNREALEEQEKKDREEGTEKKKSFAGWTRTEKSMLFIIVIAEVLCIVRYVILR